MRLPLLLALLDAAAGLHLIGWAYRRKQRDKPGVLIVRCVLMVCALALAISGVRRQEAPLPVGPVPAAPSASV